MSEEEQVFAKESPALLKTRGGHGMLFGGLPPTQQGTLTRLPHAVCR